MINMIRNITDLSFFNNAATVSSLDSAIALSFALLMGLFIFLVYQKSHRGEMYSVSFGVTLILMTLVSTLLILAVSSNALLSLGMVGALSIVRFRAAVEEPMDIAFLFWAIASGIVLAAGLIPLAVLGSVFIGAVMFVFSSYGAMMPTYIVMVRCQAGESENTVCGIVRSECAKMTLKSRSLYSNEVELALEVRLRSGYAGFLDKISAVDGVSTAIISSNKS